MFLRAERQYPNRTRDLPTRAWHNRSRRRISQRFQCRAWGSNPQAAFAAADFKSAAFTISPPRHCAVITPQRRVRIAVGVCSPFSRLADHRQLDRRAHTGVPTVAADDLPTVGDRDRAGRPASSTALRGRWAAAGPDSGGSATCTADRGRAARARAGAPVDPGATADSSARRGGEEHEASRESEMGRNQGSPARNSESSIPWGGSAARKRAERLEND